ncbi:sulfatase family protein [Rhodopirellula sp. JC639]|uniref:sulfatase family protein n=1 Tax=Stieleria mannarensis TaxID=2755585 RepID=UPI001C7289CA|nr:arylsulfatase [Rhodopirellula sp. JC639]
MKRYLLLCCLFFAVSAQASDRPNIVFILADDMGYGDVQALNPESQIPTPNLDRLAAEGMTFTDAHSPSAVCTPTRYATLTGRYCWRSKLKRGVLNGYGTPLIETDRPTVASHLKQHGYHTAVIGKWHLGLGFQKDASGQWDWTQPLSYSPVDAGFTQSLVIPASLDFPPYVYIDGHQITGKPDRVQPARPFPAYLRKGELGSDFSIVDCLDQLTAKASQHIRSRADQDEPFFLYFPLTAPHKPVLPHGRFAGKTKLGPYGDFVTQVDWTVGQVMAAIDEAGLAKNTLVIYTSDNGSFMRRQSDAGQVDHVSDESIQAYYEGNHKANGPWRGTKADIWEGGHRVPFFARWTGTIKAGSQCDQPICHADLFATAAELAGTKLPPADQAAPDSFSIAPLLHDKPDQFRRAPVVNHSVNGTFAIRDGKWKLVFSDGSGGREKPSGKPFGTPWQLYDLDSDPTESKDLAETNRELVEKLGAELFRFLADEKSR